MICSNCKCKIEQKESFEKMANRVLKATKKKLERESNFGIPDTKEKQWKKTK
tara:strand:- start:633 stop:788 length:156 start_codon:yes stop_codon:yes gene_type:complete